MIVVGEVVVDQLVHPVDQRAQLGDLLTGLKGAGEINGKLYGVPTGGNTWGYIYSPALFAQAGVEEPKEGWTWDDYRAAVKAIAEKTGVSGGGNYVGSYYNLELQLRQEGKLLYTEDGEIGVDAATVQSLPPDIASLASLQGESPLILPSVDESAVAAVVEDWTGERWMVTVAGQTACEAELLFVLADAG